MANEKSRSYFEKELKKIRPCTEAERDTLLATKGENEESLQRLVEGYLYKLVPIAALYETEKIPFMDLIQEGSLALSEFFQNLDQADESFDKKLEKAVTKKMEAFAKDENNNQRAGEELVQKLNAIDFFASKIAETKGREATKEELAELMNIPVSEVENLLKIALEILEGDNQ